MSAHDRYLANHHSYFVRAVCAECGNEWNATYVEEYGAGWLEPREDCAQCGSTEIDTSELDAEDIAERRYASRGEDF